VLVFRQVSCSTLGLQNCRAIHGKEKVYGSIP
jgi:hypothetical protein